MCVCVRERERERERKREREKDTERGRSERVEENVCLYIKDSKKEFLCVRKDYNCRRK